MKVKQTYKKQIINRYIKFRNNMGASTDNTEIEQFWGEIEVKKHKEINNPISKEKINIVKNNIQYLLVFDWVKYIAITGSIAAGTVKEDDDIDVYIVVKNNRMWIFRVLQYIKTFRNKKISRLGISKNRVLESDNNKICINYIAEERGIIQSNKDIFTLHEILRMIPVYNEKYKEVIINKNTWIYDDYLVNRHNFIDKNISYCNIFLEILNFFFFLLQSLLMIYHKYSLHRAWSNYMHGKIEFFPQFSRKVFDVKEE